MRNVLRAAALTAALVSPASAAEVDVTCGDTFSGVGRLVGDCTGTITIVKGRLLLQGFTISGAGLSAVECLRSCRVIGPGSIVSAGSTFGISGEAAVHVAGVTVSGHDAVGVRAGDVGRLRIEESVITQNGVGVRGARVKIADSEVDGNASTGIAATIRGVKLVNTYVRDNGGHGISTDLGAPHGNRIKGKDMFVTGNGRFGVLARMVSGIALIAGNAQDPACGDTEACADIGSVLKPRFRRHTCDTSMQIPEQFAGPVPFGPDWDLCRFD